MPKHGENIRKRNCEGYQGRWNIYGALENEQKVLEEQFEPTGQLLLSNEPWACFSSYKCAANAVC